MLYQQFTNFFYVNLCTWIIMHDKKCKEIPLSISLRGS